jgi:hypothetical protein
MQESFENPEPLGTKPKTSAITIVIGAVVVLAILASLWFLFEPLENQRGSSLKETIAVKMNPTEQEYASKIEIGKIEMSRAENFLHQEVTTLSGELYNAGTEPVSTLILTTEFFDTMNQVVLRETRKVLGAPGAALAPGERRPFEISFEHVPDSWNMQAPAVRISHLQLATRKE